MGSSSSKAAQGAARKFPTRSPGAAVPPPSTTGRSAAAAAGASAPRHHQAQQQAQQQADPASQDTDASRPQASSSSPSSSDITQEFSSRLRQMGIVQPNPTYSPTSRADLGPDPSASKPDAAPLQAAGGAPVYPSASRNPTLAALEARRDLARRAELEFEQLGTRSSEGREFLDMHTIVQVHLLREKGYGEREIEERFDLKKGVVGRLGRSGVTVPASLEERAEA